jgi:hypothetical protein
MKTPACNNDFTSECRLQTRLTMVRDVGYCLDTVQYWTSSQPHRMPTVRKQKTPAEIFRLPLVLAWYMSTVAYVFCHWSIWGHFNHDGWINIRGRQQVQLERDLAHKSNGIIWFYALWRGVWSVHSGCACIFGILNCCNKLCCWLLTCLYHCFLNLTVVNE